MSEEKGKISVIVPVYQAEKYLAKALDSVISQDYENWELFLLVRKSSDQSEKIARDYEKKYDSIHMIERGENKVGEARNQGLEKAQGEYVLFLDSDDYLPDASVMQRYVRMAEQTDADIVVANSGTEKCCLQSATHLFPDIIEILRNFSFAASFPPGHFLMSGENFIADRFWKRIRSVSQNMIMQKINFSTCSVISAVQNIFSFPGSATFIEKMKHPYPAGTVQIPASAGLRWHAI